MSPLASIFLVLEPNKIPDVERENQDLLIIDKKAFLKYKMGLAPKKRLSTGKVNSNVQRNKIQLSIVL